MDAVALLKADHKRIGHLIAKLELTTERSSKFRAELFERLSREMAAHMHFEEEILYPALKDYKQTRSLSLEAMEEHKALRLLLEEIASVAPDTDEWEVKFTVLAESVKLHIEEKERELFPKARRVLSPEEWENLNVSLEEEKLRFTVAPFRLVQPA